MTKNVPSVSIQFDSEYIFTRILRKGPRANGYNKSFTECRFELIRRFFALQRVEDGPDDTNNARYKAQRRVRIPRARTDDSHFDELLVDPVTQQALEANLGPRTEAVLAVVRPKSGLWMLFEVPFPTTEEKTAQISTWWHQEITKIDPVSANSQPPSGFLSLVRKPIHLS